MRVVGEAVATSVPVFALVDLPFVQKRREVTSGGALGAADAAGELALREIGAGSEEVEKGLASISHRSGASEKSASGYDVGTYVPANAVR